MSQWVLTPEQLSPIKDPDWKVIEEYLTQLDGEKRSVVTLKRKAKGELIVGGGNLIENEALYHVGYSYIVDDELEREEEEEGIEPVYDGDRIFHLIDPSKSDTKEFLIKISQLSNLPENMCVNKQIMLDAVKYFYKYEKLHPRLNWIEAS
ncbi:hypothetical protein GCM10007416_13680 [Kroppenstedtia guangzhouensis]|uniref:Immunity protein Imm1 n=1 Tax=Kroppenstedtia guangzhouensis TaxID=1274356 RepID=A0ABQ1GEC3_9BACL|nr:hypothetical protein [Kroppenstedtia guangzhouensis]GGA42010.1 hypothetical protein GCM10007416_13680 [Kroppenstedtia guangzhouensis]